MNIADLKFPLDKSALLLSDLQPPWILLDEKFTINFVLSKYPDSCLYVRLINPTGIIMSKFLDFYANLIKNRMLVFCNENFEITWS